MLESLLKNLEFFFFLHIIADMFQSSPCDRINNLAAHTQDIKQEFHVNVIYTEGTGRNLAGKIFLISSLSNKTSI